MRYLKKYNSFFEDGTACATAGVGGMGAVSNAGVGALAGVGGTPGSGDVTFTFKKEKRKKGNPSQVSDMRDLSPAKGVNKVDDIKESKKELTQDENDTIQDCLVELLDMGFEVNQIELDSEDEEYDLDDDNQGKFKSQEIRISLFKQVEKVWRGNLSLRYKFDKNEFYHWHTSTLRPGGNKLEQYESEIVEVSEDTSHKLINHLDYTSGTMTIYFEAPGMVTNWNWERNINVNIHIVLNRNIYPTNESYNDEQEYINDIIDMLSNYNIRPVVLTHIINQYEDQITNYFNDGKSPKFFVDEIVKDFELDSGGFLSHRLGSKSWQDSIKYL